MVYYEVSQPICLEEELKRFDYFEAKDEHVRRLNALRAVNSLVIRWVKYVSWQKGLPPEQVERAGGKLFTFGSYRLGVHTRGADIDSLCVAPRHVHRRDFFTSFYEMLKEDKKVTGLHAIEHAFVPVIKLKYNGIELDILFARLDVSEITAEMSLDDDNLLRNLDEKSVRSLNGCRVADEIWRSIPNKTAFTVALRAVKLWAKNRLIYSNSLGFLGGISWAILVAKTCQRYPNANASMVVEKLFKLFSTWDWPAPVFIKDPNSHTRPDIPYLNELVWDPKTKPTDGRHLMPIITPAFPEQDSAFNVTRSARTLITKEFRQGLENVMKIAEGKGDWKSLFNEMLFFKGYKDYVCVICSTSTPEDHVVYSGLVESKIRHLVMLLDQNEHILLCHVNKKNFKPRHNSRFSIDYGFGGLVTTLWFIGIVKVRNSARMLDLEEETHHFTELVTNSALQAGIYKQSMHLRLAQVKDMELKAWIPAYEVDGYEPRIKQDTVAMPVTIGDDPHYDEHGRSTIPNIDDGTRKVAYCPQHAYHLETIKVPTKIPDCFPREVVHPFLPLNACYASRRHLNQEQPAEISSCECPQCSERENVFVKQKDGGLYDKTTNSTNEQHPVSVVDIQEWHFGNYCVWFNFTKAIQLLDENSVTLCTHGTVGYSRFVFDHADHWKDQISFALLVDPAGFPALSVYHKFHKCTSASERVSTHLVWSRHHGECSPDFIVQGLSSQPPDPMPDDCNLETHLALFKHSPQDPYPPNTLRNIARKGARTQSHLIADIEGHFSQDAAEVVRSFTDTIKARNTAIVIRRFESDQEEIPRNVSVLKQLFHDEKAEEFHLRIFPEGHSVPFLRDFFNYSMIPDTVPRLTPVNYPGPDWEPQLVVHESHPLHFEGIPIRCYDQQTLSYELCRLRINFAVASHVFSIHKGIKTVRSQKETQDYRHVKEQIFYMNKFRKHIRENYPDTENLCGEF